jgi:hypothetical protein
MEMKRPAAFVAIAAALAVASPLLAEGMGRHGGGKHLRLDLNGDGGITREESDAAGAVRFLRLDRDGDGAVTEAEMLEVAQERVARRVSKKFARLDQNGDGRVERAEFEDRGAAQFARLDADGDGQISREEFRAHRRGHGRHRQSHGHGDGSGRGWHNDRLPDE